MTSNTRWMLARSYTTTRDLLRRRIVCSVDRARTALVVEGRWARSHWRYCSYANESTSVLSVCMTRARVLLALILIATLLSAGPSPAEAEIGIVAVDIDPSDDFSHSGMSISGDGEWIVSTRPEGGIVLWNAGSRVTTEIDSHGFTPVISFDGRWIAYVRRVASNWRLREIVLKDRLSPGSERIISNQADHWFPSMSNDGSVIAWRSRTGNSSNIRVEVWRRSTGTVLTRPITLGPLPMVSGNGRYVFHRPDSLVGRSVRWDLATGRSIELPAAASWYWDVSDDGNTVAYAIPVKGSPVAHGVGVHTIVGGGDRKIDAPADQFGVGLNHIVMSGDGSTLTFSSRQQLAPGSDTRLGSYFKWHPQTGEIDFFDADGPIVDFSTDGSIAAVHGTTTYQYLDFKIRPGTVAAASSVDEIRAASDYSANDASLLRLYRAFFNREPDDGGAVYWTGVSRRGNSLIEIAQFFTAVPEYRNVYDGTTDREFLTAVYANVLGRDFDQNGYDYWLDLLSGTNEYGDNPSLDQLSRGAVVRWVTGSKEFKNNYPYDPIVG